MRVVTVDPDPSREATYSTLEEAAESERIIDVVVVATPPDRHLSDIEFSNTRWSTPRILCEKPLFGLETDLIYAAGVLEWSIVMPAYNYRFHPQVKIARELFRQTGLKSFGYQTYYNLRCVQRRNKQPEWGFLLDHLSHDIDILVNISGGTVPDITSASYERDGDAVIWNVSGLLGESPFSISEIIYKNTDVKRSAILDILDVNSNHQLHDCYDLYATTGMYQDMWKFFLESYYRIGTLALRLHIIDAMKTQKALQEAYKYANHK